MIWTEETPISVANLNDMEMRIATALANMDNGKAIIAAAIQAMGQSASGGLTFAQLADKIKDISKDADAAAGNVLTGKTFYQGGVKRTGSMPNRTGHINAQSISLSGTTLRLRPPAGYYPGTSDNSVQYNDPNFVQSNIRKGVSLFGLTGTWDGHHANGELPDFGYFSGAGGFSFTNTFNVGFAPRYVIFYGGRDNVYTASVKDAFEGFQTRSRFTRTYEDDRWGVVMEVDAFTSSGFVIKFTATTAVGNYTLGDFYWQAFG